MGTRVPQSVHGLWQAKTLLQNRRQNVSERLHIYSPISRYKGGLELSDNLCLLEGDGARAAALFIFNCYFVTSAIHTLRPL